MTSQTGEINSNLTKQPRLPSQTDVRRDKFISRFIPPHPRHTHGLTLIEILAVIMIISIITVIGAPIMTNYAKNLRLKSAASQIAELVHLARNLATTNNEEYTLTIHTRTDSSPNQIEIIRSSDSANVEKTWIAPPLIEIPDVSGSTGAVDIDFSSYGTASSLSIHIIQRGTQISGGNYSPSGVYSGLGTQERVKCYTVGISNTTGLPSTYYYGRGSPWATTDL